MEDRQDAGLPTAIEDFVLDDLLARFIVMLVREVLELGAIESAFASAKG